jgi:flagellar basal body-associated protein FliL
VKLPIPKGRRAILVLGLPLGLAAGGALAFTMLSSSPKAAPAIPDPSPGQVGPMLALDDRVINLTTTTAGAFKYAKIGVTIELRPSTAGFYDLHGADRTKSETTELAKFTDNVPLLQDAVGAVVSAHDSSTLTTADGRAALKSELLSAVRKVMGDKEVLDIFFTDFVMQ